MLQNLAEIQKQAKVIKLFIFAVIVGLGIFFIATHHVKAESGFLRCYNRKLEHSDITCSLCGAANADGSTSCSAGQVFDKASCTCVDKTKSCDGYNKGEIEDDAADCYKLNKFWNDNYCVCIGSKDISPVSSFTGGGANSLTDNFFFSVNWSGDKRNIPEMIRFVVVLVFAVMAAVAVFLGIYGIYLYTTAGENDDQIKTANKVFKNALIGIAIAVMGVVIVQGVAMLFGVESSELFQFKF